MNRKRLVWLLLLPGLASPWKQRPTQSRMLVSFDQFSTEDAVPPVSKSFLAAMSTLQLCLIFSYTLPLVAVISLSQASLVSPHSSAITKMLMVMVAVFAGEDESVAVRVARTTPAGEDGAVPVSCRLVVSNVAQLGNAAVE